MAMDVHMPQLGESVTEGTLTKWLKKPGDPIEKYEPLCEVATDKVNAEVPATMDGTLLEILVEEGRTVAVGELICRIEEVGEERQTPVSHPEEVPFHQEESQSMKTRYSPAVLRLAQEYELDLSRLQGSGKGGRITRKDVLRAIEPDVAPLPSISPEPVSSLSGENAPKNPPKEEPGDTIIPLTPIRKTIAQRMVKSKQEIPHAWTMMEADVSSLVALRQRVKKDFLQREGIPLTYLPFFIKAVVDSLKEYPHLNSVWAEDQLVLKKQINISIAVATTDALFVPVIHDADEKSIFGLAKSLHQLIEKTRAGKLQLADLQGGTFTVNNTGSFGSVASYPVINPPQAAILSFESIVKKPVVIDDMIAIRDRMNLCLSIDHRILDGWTAGKFLQRVKERLETIGEEDFLG